MISLLSNLYNESITKFQMLFLRGKCSEYLETYDCTNNLVCVTCRSITKSEKALNHWLWSYAASLHNPGDGRLWFLIGTYDFCMLYTPWALFLFYRRSTKGLWVIHPMWQIFDLPVVIDMLLVLEVMTAGG